MINKLSEKQVYFTKREYSEWRYEYTTGIVLVDRVAGPLGKRKFKYKCLCQK